MSVDLLPSIYLFMCLVVSLTFMLFIFAGNSSLCESCFPDRQLLVSFIYMSFIFDIYLLISDCSDHVSVIT